MSLPVQPNLLKEISCDQEKLYSYRYLDSEWKGAIVQEIKAWGGEGISAPLYDLWAYRLRDMKLGAWRGGKTRGRGNTHA